MKGRYLMCPRRGYSLLEIMTVISVLAVLMPLAAMFFSATLQTQRQAQVRARQRAEFARLDGILRADAHAASQVIVKSPLECELKSNQGVRWTYRTTEDGLVRERWQEDRRKQRETFFLRPGMDVRFRSQMVAEATQTADERTLLLLDIQLPPSEQRLQAKQQPYHGEVLVGGAIPAGKSAEVQP